VDGINKLEGARRQIETAIELFFDNKDSLSVHTLAWSAFKVLFDLYPHKRQDDFAARIDAMMGNEGWKAMSGVANFLKHANKDPDALLEPHHPVQGMAIIGLATLLYRRLADEFTLKMMAFDYWTDELGYEELGLPEVDENAQRADEFKKIREQIRELPFDAQIMVGKKLYEHFVEHYAPAKRMVDEAAAEGLTLTQLLDQRLRLNSPERAK
jgi:hypothetical protein